MPRPHPSRQGEPESEDSRSCGGLADMLEPDAPFDTSFDEAITSMRSLGVASAHGGSLRAGRDAPPLSARAPVPVQVQDFAFADTVFANELDEAPPSSPIFVSDPLGNTQCVTPLAFPLPPPGDDVGFATRIRVVAAHVRHGFRGAREEMRDLWAATYEIVASSEPPAQVAQPGATLVLRRMLALWSCFQWSRADLTRAAMIGFAVFVTAGAIGATTLDFADRASGGGPAAASGSSPEVRARHTLDQHTGKRVVSRPKR